MLSMNTDKWICGHCGQENDENFCIQCGSMRNPNEDSLMWFCPKCGRKNNDLFCEKCGTKRPTFIDSTNSEAEALKDGEKLPVASVRTHDDVTDETDDKLVAPVATIMNDKHELEDDIHNDTAINDEHHVATTAWICQDCGERNNELFCEKCGAHKPSNYNLDKTIRAETKIVMHRNESVDKYQESESNNDVVQIQSNESIKTDSVTITTPSLNQSSTTHSPESDSKKIFFAGCIFALLVIIGILGFKIYEKMNEDTTSAARVSPTQEISNKVDISKATKSGKDSSKEKKDKSDVKDNTIKSDNAQSVTKPSMNIPTAAPAQPKVYEPTDIANANGQNQKEAIRALYDFHKNITEHKLQNAYGIFSPAMQGRASYDGWALGFNTTVSSTPSDVKVASESDSRIVLTYYLQAVDNPGGTQNFTGTAVMVKVGDTWKIDEVTNKIK